VISPCCSECVHLSLICDGRTRVFLQLVASVNGKLLVTIVALVAHYIGVAVFRGGQDLLTFPVPTVSRKGANDILRFGFPLAFRISLGVPIQLQSFNSSAIILSRSQSRRVVRLETSANLTPIHTPPHLTNQSPRIAASRHVLFSSWIIFGLPNPTHLSTVLI
jgi:hypothetical protein